MSEHRVVSESEWLEARQALLAREKEHSRARDAMSAARRALPWRRVEADYRFEGPEGTATLADLFGGRSQLIVYHFMFDPDWDAGCKSCSFLVDHLQGVQAHLAAKDVTLVAVSRAPLAKLEAFKQRMGWKHAWVSSAGSRFNFDFGVSFTPDQVAAGGTYNYRHGPVPVSELPGLSVFRRNADGIFHTYSTYARGLDDFIGTYTLLDLVPRGRDEPADQYSMSWVRLHDAYEAGS